MHFVNQYDEVMAQNFTKHLVNQGGICLAAQSISEFPFDCAKRRFNVGAKVVMLQELLAAVIKIVEHLPIVTAASVPDRIRPEGNKRSTAELVYSSRILVAAIGGICAHFGNLEIASSGFQQRLKELRITGVLLSHFYGGHYVCLYSGHEMNLDPFLLCLGLAVLHIEPANEAGRAEPAGVNGKLRLYRLQRQTTLLNQGAQNRR